MDRQKVMLYFDSAMLDKAENQGRVGGFVLRPAEARGLFTVRQTPSCKNHSTVSAAESAAARAFAKSAWQLTFTSAFFATYM